MMNISTEARSAVDRLMAFTAQQNGINDPGRVFNVSPTVEQTIETRVMQSNAFLSQINNHPVENLKGSILGFDVPATITKRTRTPDPARNSSLRRPTDPTGLVERGFELFEVEQDTVISWDKIDMWAHLNNFYERYRNMVMFAQARDRLLIAWNGQAEAADTDPATYPFLEDVNKGFFQFMIEENPDQAVGLNSDGSINPIKIDPKAADADFSTINQLAYYLRFEVMHRLFQNRNNMRILIGDELTISENIELLGMEQDKSSERVAAEKLLPNAVYGETRRIKADEFPRRGVFLSPLNNFSRYYQRGSTRRKISENDHEHKGIVEYNFTREDYVLEAAEAAVCVHPDAILLKDESGNWAPIKDMDGNAITWKMA